MSKKIFDLTLLKPESSVRESNKTLKASNDKLLEMNAALSSALTAANDALDTSTGEIKDLEGKLELASQEIERLQSEQQTTGQAAAQIAASAGLAEDDTPEASHDPQSLEDKKKHFMALSQSDPAAAAEYFAQNPDLAAA